MIDEETGLLAQLGDGVSLEKALDRLIQDKQLRKRLGENGRKHYEDKFSDNQMAKSCLEIYTRLVENPSQQVH